MSMVPQLNWIEHETSNLGVAGSNPAGTAKRSINVNLAELCATAIPAPPCDCHAFVVSADYALTWVDGR